MRSAASRAASRLSATTAATNCPRYAIASDWNSSSSGSGTWPSVAALPCQSTASTPGRASTASVSTERTVPCATGDATGQTYANPSTG